MKVNNKIQNIGLQLLHLLQPDLGLKLLHHLRPNLGLQLLQLQYTELLVHQIGL